MTHPFLWSYIGGMESPFIQSLVVFEPKPEAAHVSSSAASEPGTACTHTGAASACALDPVLVTRGESINLGLVAYGGESQNGTMHASLNGTACARIKDWEQIHAWGESVGAHITRADTAHDDFTGEILNIEQVRNWYSEGFFSSSGRPPTAQLVDDLGSGKGKTFYIGNRAHGKLTRFYQKGKKAGDANSPWVRAEVEWRNALKRAKIQNFRWHDLRHAWASWHIQKGTPLHVTQKLGSWSSVDMVRRYAHLSC